MKKALTIILAVAMLASIACIGASAKVLITDTFDNYGNDVWIWPEEPIDGIKVSEFNGSNMLEMSALVHQSKYTSDEDNGGMLNEGTVVTTGTFWVDIYTEFSAEENDGSVGLWFANYYYVREEGGDQDTYYLKYAPKTSQVSFFLDTKRELEGVEDEKLTIATYDVPGAPGENAKGGKAIQLGMRVDQGKITAFVDGKAVGSFEDATIGTSCPSPVLFWNDSGLHTYFDNFAIGDLDELKADAPATDTPSTDAPATDAPAADAPATDAPATTAPAPADTNPAPSNPVNGSAQTGDAAIVVLATMIVALGSAIVVKKVSGK